MRESSRDCYQDLTIFIREVEKAVREIMGDSCFKKHQHYKFEAEFGNAKKRRPVQALPSR